ncbi:hypothetical protein [Nostoc sp.]
MADSTRHQMQLVKVQTMYKSFPPQRVAPIPFQQVRDGRCSTWANLFVRRPHCLRNERSKTGYWVLYAGEEILLRYLLGV